LHHPPSLGPRSQRTIRLLSARLLSAPGKITLADLKAMKLSTRSELADHFVDDLVLVAAARRLDSPKIREAAEILAKWDRQGETTSDGTLLFLPAFGATSSGSGRADLDLAGNGIPSALGGIRTLGTGPFVDGRAQIQGGDTFYAVIEFSKNGLPVGEALLGYGNWSRVGSKHVDDQLALASQEKMRPIVRAGGDRETAGEPARVLARRRAATARGAADARVGIAGHRSYARQV
jgi:hypothetical protein